jgi:riboflavin synthase
MFSGIVEEIGRVEAVRRTALGRELLVRARVCGQDVKLGDSVAVNGCCLTVEKMRGTGAARTLQFTLLEETWHRTNLASATPGAGVNLERALKLGDRLGGHLVAGHVDGTGKILRWEKAGRDHVLEISAGPDILRYVVFKGSITVDGISLTVAKLKPRGFELWIIPHTYEVTVLHERKVGDWVNLEADLVGKYIEQFVTARRLGSSAGRAARSAPRVKR